MIGDTDGSVLNNDSERPRRGSRTLTGGLVQKLLVPARSRRMRRPRPRPARMNRL